MVHYGLGAVHPADIDEMIAAAVKSMRPGDWQSHPYRNTGVRLTPAEIEGSSADTDILVPSDPDILPPQKPYMRNPSEEEVVVRAPFDDHESLGRFARLYHHWGGAVTRDAAVDLASAAYALLDELRTLPDADPSIVHRALVAALNAATATKPKSSGKSSFLAYFRRVLASELDRMRLSDKSLEAAAYTEQRVAEDRLKKRISGGGARKGERPLSTSELAAIVFGYGEEV